MPTSSYAAPQMRRLDRTIALALYFDVASARVASSLAAAR
jgi:hypothetical protein